MDAINKYLNEFFKDVKSFSKMNLKVSNILDDIENVTQFYARCVQNNLMDFTNNFIAYSDFRKDFEDEKLIKLILNQKVLNYTNDEIAKIKEVLGNQNLKEKFLSSVKDTLTEQPEWENPQIKFLYPAHIYNDVLNKDTKFQNLYGDFDEDMEIEMNDWAGTIDCISILMIFDEILNYANHQIRKDALDVITKNAMTTIRSWNPFLEEKYVRNFIKTMYVDRFPMENSEDRALEDALSIL